MLVRALLRGWGEARRPSGALCSASVDRPVEAVCTLRSPLPNLLRRTSDASMVARLADAEGPLRTLAGVLTLARLLATSASSSSSSPLSTRPPPSLRDRVRLCCSASGDRGVPEEEALSFADRDAASVSRGIRCVDEQK